MARMTKLQAKQLAEMLFEEERALLLAYVKRTGGNFSVGAVNNVISHKLIEKTVDLLTGKEIWILTPNGKKVAAALTV